MISSMTGFAAAAHESAQGSLTVELKTVNHRYLEFQTRIPEELRPLEPAMREAVASRLTRGKVDLRITFTPVATAKRSLTPDLEAMATLQAASRDVLTRFPDARPLSVAEVLHWPGVLADETLSPDRVKAEVMALVAKALEDLNQTRRREGAKLDFILRERLDRMSALVKEAEPLMPGAVKAFADKLAAKVAEAARPREGGRLRQAPGLPLPGAQPRGEYPRVEVGRERHHARLGGAQGSHRADARASAKHRVMLGNLFVVVAPSGTGKTTLVDELLKREPNIQLSPSFTTRMPRIGEVDGVDYFFVDRRRFERMIAAGEFLEYADVYGNYYGTGREWIERQLEGDHDVLLEIDWQGARQVRALFPQMVGIFLLPPSLAELRRRLEARGKDPPESIERRMASAREEISHVLEFEYIIVNERFEAALNDLLCVVHAARVSRAQQAIRRSDLLDQFK
jgi:guanylate kinase